MRRRKFGFRPPRAAVIVLVAAVALCLLMVCCRSRRQLGQGFPPSLPPDQSLVLVTGYCNCQSCCGWRRSWFGFGRPVYAYGAMKGKPKEVGVTARGTKARHGTVAADPAVFPFGTRLEIPGYGTGVVEDTGGAIKGRHIDIWFSSHDEARAWGERWLDIKPTASAQ